MNSRSSCRAAAVLCCVLWPVAASAQTFEVLHGFAGESLTAPGRLLLDADGTIYGVAQSGGPTWSGGLFKRTPDGRMTPLHHFTGADGRYPTNVIKGSDGALYGN